MEPVTLISSAIGIAKAAGLGDWLSKKIAGTNGRPLAEKVAEIAMEATGVPTPEMARRYIEHNEAVAQEVRAQLVSASRDLVALMFRDTENARDMQKAALAQDDVFSKRFAYFLASFWSAAAVIYIGCITFLPIPAENLRFADSSQGFVLGTIVATILQFFFGSSMGSQLKTEILSNLKNKGNSQ